MTRKEVEYTKLHTLYMMLEQEKKNLEKLRENDSNSGEIAKAEVNIRTLQEQLRQSTNDVSFRECLSVFGGTRSGNEALKLQITALLHNELFSLISLTPWPRFAGTNDSFNVSPACCVVCSLLSCDDDPC